MRNPFRQPLLKLAFDEMVRAHDRRAGTLFLPSGDRNMGNSAACMFWRGYDGIQIGAWDRASKETFAYPQWLAGKACRKALDS
jgi:hypothetical protein